MDFVRSCVVMTLILALGGFGLTACGQGDVPTIDPDSEIPGPAPLDEDPIEMPESATTDEDIALVETEVEEDILWDSGLLQNGSFEEWTNGHPVGWEIRATGGNEIRTTNSHQGDYAISLPDVAGVYPMIVQIFSSDTLRGHEVEFGAMMLADENGKFAVQIRYTLDGEEVRRTLTHPGNSIWVPLNTKVEIPEDIESEHVEFVIFRRPNTEGLTLADSAYLNII